MTRLVVFSKWMSSNSVKKEKTKKTKQSDTVLDLNEPSMGLAESYWTGEPHFLGEGILLCDKGANFNCP